jgi:hypothetical protein
MNINLSQLAPYVWFLAAFLVVVAAFIAVRFFWQHVLKYLLQGCLAILGIIALLAVLHFVFKLF